MRIPVPRDRKREHYPVLTRQKQPFIKKHLSQASVILFISVPTGKIHRSYMVHLHNSKTQRSDLTNGEPNLILADVLLLNLIKKPRSVNCNFFLVLKRRKVFS